MEKVTITIDVLKVDKNKIVERRWTDKNNREVIMKELKLDVVPLNEPKLIKEGDTWAMWKTHFVTITQSKEQRDAKQKSTIIGEGIMFKQKVTPDNSVEIQHDEEVSASDIPF